MSCRHTDFCKSHIFRKGCQTVSKACTDKRNVPVKGYQGTKLDILHKMTSSSKCEASNVWTIIEKVVGFEGINSKEVGYHI